MIFEFLSVVPAAQQADTIRRCLEGLGVLSNRLQETAPMYAGLLKPFADSLGEEVTGAPVAQSPPRPDDALSSVEGDPID